MWETGSWDLLEVFQPDAKENKAGTYTILPGWHSPASAGRNCLPGTQGPFSSPGAACLMPGGKENVWMVLWWWGWGV